MKSKDGWTALHFAAEKGHVECVELLLREGAEVDARSLTGSTPLHLAAERGRKECMTLLLSARACRKRCDRAMRRDANAGPR